VDAVLVAAVLGIALVAGSLYLVRDLGQRDGGPSRVPSSAGPAAMVDPQKVCDVPAYDPSISLLVGDETAPYPNRFLDKPGAPASALLAYGADQLRAFLATHEAANAPSDGWRMIQNTLRTVAFAAPDPGFSDGWWLVAFELDGSTWHRTDFEIVSRTPTPAQRGRDLSLHWTDDVELAAGTWNDPLELVNTGPDAKAYGPSDLAAIPHVFTDDGEEVAVGAVVPSGVDGSDQLAPGEQTAMPIALTATLPSLEPGSYQVVACVPRLALASTIGGLDVVSTGVAPDLALMTYPSNGAGMTALAFGTLSNVDGCLAIQARHQVSYLVMPDGYAVVERSGRQVLIGPTGDEQAVMGEDVSLGGGYTPPPFDNPRSTIDVPPACVSDKGGYFVASGVQSAG
jgi:hypothetical protein